MIRLDKVSFRYDGSADAILRDISLTIESGERVCLLGGNGSGKTTLALIIAGILAPVSGSVKVTCEREECRSESGDVGILFQNPDNQMIAMEVGNDIAFSLENRGVSRESMLRQVAGQLASFDLVHLSDRVISTLSGGEKQQVALCGVMIDAPPILILDEPDSFLDSERREKLLEELRRIRRERPSIIEIHLKPRPTAAESYSRVCVLNEGRLVYDGLPNEIVRDKGRLGELGLGGDVSCPGSLDKAKVLSGDRAGVLMRDVSFSYGKGSAVLDSCSLSVGGGELVGLTGGTGSGKTTIGQLLCGLIEPMTGEIRFADKSGEKIDPKESSVPIAGTFQQPERQFFLGSCAAEVRFGPENMGASLSDERVSALLQQVGLDGAEFFHRDPLTLSLGEKRRLAFACVLSMDPAFIVFDEPTAGLDLAGLDRFRKLAVELRNEGRGILVISHETDMIESLCDRVYRVDNGKVERVVREGQIAR